MKIITACVKCHEEYGYIFSALNELNDKGFYKVVCPNGHVGYNYLTAKKFEIFFDIGLHALLDGYSDASVSRFAVSLERFYEFCIQVWLFTAGVQEKEFKIFWSSIALRSEAQSGAFHSLFTMEQARDKNLFLLKPLDTAVTTFRNRIEHTGRIPGSEEVQQYAAQLYEFMKTILKHLQVQHANSFKQATNVHLNKIAEFMKNEGIDPFLQVSLNIPTVLGRYINEDKTFEEMLEQFRNNKTLNKHAMVR